MMLHEISVSATGRQDVDILRHARIRCTRDCAQSWTRPSRGHLVDWNIALRTVDGNVSWECWQLLRTNVISLLLVLRSLRPTLCKPITSYYVDSIRLDSTRISSQKIVLPLYAPCVGRIPRSGWAFAVAMALAISNATNGSPASVGRAWWHASWCHRLCRS